MGKPPLCTHDGVCVRPIHQALDMWMLDLLPDTRAFHVLELVLKVGAHSQVTLPVLRRLQRLVKSRLCSKSARWTRPAAVAGRATPGTPRSTRRESLLMHPHEVSSACMSWRTSTGQDKKTFYADMTQ